MAEISRADSCYVFACVGLAWCDRRPATDMMLQNFVALGLLSMLWYVLGFSLSFGAGEWVGGLDYFMWQNVKKREAWPGTAISVELFGTFQMMFAVITPILMTGAFVDRMRFGPFCLFLCLWSVDASVLPLVPPDLGWGLLPAEGR
ncbi:unnamed protein product [Polarella glacialis]|uniref:Ammonium transporter AmtB-like domain-containing protein n=1 Tax=Polarella glacialis TaxID=89957 RepID=A0A813KR04_POLGL|nr:unnamed protein product [Polarella glacialis]